MIVSATPTFIATTALDPYLRVKLTAGKLVVAGATDNSLGTLEQRVLAANDAAAVIPHNAQGSRKMVAAGAIAQYADVYGAAGGKVNDVANENHIGIAMEAASGDGSIIEVLPQTWVDELDNLGDIGGNLVIDDDFIGDYPAAATALTANGWTKVETLGLGVISSDEANGVIKFVFDAVAEAATAALYMVNAPFDIDRNPICEFRLAIFDIGDDAALDINFGLANDTHATDADLITESCFFHLDGASLLLLAECDDGSNETAATSTTVTLVDDTWYDFKIDMSDKSDIKFFYRLSDPDAVNPVWTALLPATTFSMAAATGTLTPIVHVEKTSNDTTADVRVDRIRCQAERN